ncbi:MAG: cytochrome c1 [Erythrobacter sp.]|nr:cytochrome c1 [Erythrobacter sp.]
MIRLVGILIGLGFTAVVMLAFGNGFYTWATEDAVETPEHVFHIAAEGPAEGYSFEGPLGRWDVAQLQRGYVVYRQVCSACHSLSHVAIRDLEELGYTEDQVKAEAASIQVPGINPDTGESTMRPATPTDYFPSPYANSVAAAAANGGKVPPDLSLITKARENGTHYVHDLLLGYREVPAEMAEEFPDFAVPPGGYYNPVFPSLSIGMTPPLTSDGQVTWAEGSPAATREQMATDVAAFLTWTAEPSLVKRKQVGWSVLGFLLFATILAWFAKKQVWAGVSPHRRKD